MAEALCLARKQLSEAGCGETEIRDSIVSSLYERSAQISAAVTNGESGYTEKQLKTDLFLTRRITGIPVMLFLLALVFFITLYGANVLSSALTGLFDKLGAVFSSLLISLGAKYPVYDALYYGMFNVLSWVVSVMLPPMAVFFPMFTILEDLGYLPRIAFNLDNIFYKCRSCGKQALTMCMGLGCNAAGVTGCRIIESPRERLIAVLTNSFMPCNGRFPMLITIITAFFAAAGLSGGIVSAGILTGFILLSAAFTFAVSYALSSTFLKGVPSSMILELPPFRRPRFSKVIIRSVFDRTIFVLGRAAAVAAPAGLVIWILANTQISGISMLFRITSFLDPLGRFLGLDGVILTAFILGLPANEIVLPLIVMMYAGGGVLTDIGPIAAVRDLLVQNGWTVITALNVCFFCLMHWPCSTTIMTIKKETGSVKYALLSMAIPTFCGAAMCLISKLFLSPLVF